jgi:hypothetical protein
VFVNRRDLLRAAGATAAISLVPRAAEAAWARIASGYRGTAGLTPAQRALVAGVADVILPRTDTPSATDVGVTEWVDLIVAEYDTDDVRVAFLAGLDAIDAQVRAERGRAFGALDAHAQLEIVRGLDDAMTLGNRGGRVQATGSTLTPEPQARAARAAYRRLKGLVIHGYFTSQRVEREVLRVRTSFPTFQGAAEHRPGTAR